MAAGPVHDWRSLRARLHDGHQGQEPAALVLAAPEEVNLPPGLPSEHSLSEAPPEDYDVVEQSRFDRTLARPSPAANVIPEAPYSSQSRQ